MYAKVSEIKAHLSKYLLKVRNGATVIVCDRTVPIAKVIPIGHEAEGLEIEEPTIKRAKIKGVSLTADVDVVELLRNSRDQR